MRRYDEAEASRDTRPLLTQYSNPLVDAATPYEPLAFEIGEGRGEETLLASFSQAIREY